MENTAAVQTNFTLLNVIGQGSCSPPFSLPTLSIVSGVLTVAAHLSHSLLQNPKGITADCLFPMLTVLCKCCPRPCAVCAWTVCLACFLPSLNSLPSYLSFCLYPLFHTHTHFLLKLDIKLHFKCDFNQCLS